jgi:hypothetical protein
MQESIPLLSFPCTFHLKVMGKSNAEFEAAVIAILHTHVPELGEAAVTRRASTQQNYISLNICFTATSRAQLDVLYTELQRCEHVLMTL